MYWPIGAPRIYAACNSKVPKDHVLELDDDAESRETTEGSGSLVETPTSLSKGKEKAGYDWHPGLEVPATPGTPLTPGINPVEDDLRRAAQAPPSKGGKNLLKFVQKEPLLALVLSRTGHLFAVITSTSLTIWQTKPTAVLAVVTRSEKSLNNYGPNVSLLVRPDSGIFVVQTTKGFLITYTLATDANSRVYRPFFDTSLQSRKQSNFAGGQRGDRILWGAGEGGGVREVSIRFRMVIKVDAGIVKALALDDELVVATEKPAAVQCIRWTPDSSGNQTSTQLLSRMEWIGKKTTVTEMVHDRPMNLSTWITADGRAYAVQRLPPPKDGEPAQKLFRGYCFHIPQNPDEDATKAAINARFSLIAVGCVDGSIRVYTARDYVGNIPPSHTHRLPVSRATSGALTCLSYSPDGYCLFAGFENGWATWSVFGKPGSTSFGIDRRIADNHDEGWLNGVRAAAWLGGGSEIMMIGQEDDRVWVMEMGRSAITGCYTSANISRTLLQTTSTIMIYRGYDLPDMTTISAEASLWHISQIPPSYLVDQWPIRCSVISPDGRYVAVAGRRGLAHYSVNSGRWKTFVSENMENEFQVRGGMCWYQHVLVAAVEAGDSFELRLYSREAALDSSLVLDVQSLPAPVVLIAPSGDDSLLVYTYDNLLYHFIFSAASGVVQLVQVGQIAFHGIVRSPARVRGLSWILPDEQLLEGDPSQDVASATVLFLVDGKLVLLQPSVNEEGKLKYDMRIIAQNIEYYVLTRDQPVSSLLRLPGSPTDLTVEDQNQDEGSGLRDSLWIFEGTDMKVWPDVQDVLRSAPADLGQELPPMASISLDFYPLSVLLAKGILLGLEPDLVQRRDVNFSFFRLNIRTQLFIPSILRFHLSRFDSPAALHLAHRYRQLEYFSHSLEILLHNVLDEEVDNPPPPDMALLPVVLSFLSSFPQYLDIIVQCTRKTEVRSWRTLFTYLPPPQELFQESLDRGSLKTAGGYLLILHAFEEVNTSSEQLVRLFTKAKKEEDWELCKELARFLTALDESGETLLEALEMVNLKHSKHERTGSSFLFQESRLQVPQLDRATHSLNGALSSDEGRSSSGRSSPQTD